MKKLLFILTHLFFVTSCTVYLGDTPKQKTEMELIEEKCQAGNKEACEVVDLAQKKKDEKNRKIIKESGIREK